MSHLYLKVLKGITDPSLPERATKLLTSPSSKARRAAVEILIDNPTPLALDRLWELRRSIEGDHERVLFRLQIEAALGACAKLAPEWLQRAILRADPITEPFETLIFLLAHLAEVEGGDQVWKSVRETVRKKTTGAENRALAYVAESFKDIEFQSSLQAWVQEDEDLVAPAALRALTFLDSPKALEALEKAPLDSSLLMAPSWWLPQLLAFHYDQTSKILRHKIESHEKPWHAAVVYDNRENLITVEILDFLLDVTEKKLEEALIQPEPENSDPLHRPFSFLAEISRLDLLDRFEARRGKRFEEVLTDYLVRQGPNDEGWYRWKVEDGISILQKVGGDGLTRLAHYYLQSARTRQGIRSGILLGIQAPQNETGRLLVEIAHDPDRGAQEEGFPLVQYEVVKALAALGLWHEMVQGCLGLGLQTPRSLPGYLEGHVFTDGELGAALTELRSGVPSPGALLAVGFSKRLALASEVRAICRGTERDSERALACLLALEQLEDPEAEDLFLDNLDSPKNGWVAERALLSVLRTPRSDQALLDRLRSLRDAHDRDRQPLTMNLLIREETRGRAAKLLWQNPDRREILLEAGDTIEYLAVLDQPDVRDFLHETAFTERRGIFRRADRHSAINGLASLDLKDEAFEAAAALFRSGDGDRLLCPETLLKLDGGKALDVFHETLRTSTDFLLIAAIGEALDRRHYTERLRFWLVDRDPQVRQGACFALEAMEWSQGLECWVLPLMQDPNWNTRIAAREAFEDLRLSRETGLLVEAITTEQRSQRRWALVDAALKIGYPGVVPGYGAHSWFGAMCEGQPFVVREHATSELEKKRKKLRDELAKRERP